MSDFFQSGNLMDIKAIHIDNYVNDRANNMFAEKSFFFFIVYLHIRELNRSAWL